MPTVKYTPLPADGASIRLLRLQPNSANDAKVQCTFFHASLTDVQKAQYEALSYTWGNTTQTIDIDLNDIIFPATVNLDTALRALRKPDEPRTLWVDALCINQSDLQEQGSQVKMMWDIYRNAERVLVWLGPEEGDSAIAMADMAGQTTQKVIRTRLTTKRKRPAHYKGVQWCGCNAGRWEVDPPRVGVQNILRRQWFTRVWVLQEVAAAKEVLVVCGSHTVSGQDFYHEITGISRHYMSFQKTIRNIRPAVEFLGSSVTTVEKQSIPLLELIETFRSWNATKAIDKVYALLNFSSDAYNEPTLQPDYTISEHLLASRLVQFAFPECTMEPHGDQQSNAVTFEIEGLVLGTINGKWSGKDNMRSWTFQTKIYSKQSQPPDLTFNARVLELFEHQWQIDILSEHRLDIDYYVCLLRGASRPTVLRYNDGKFTVAMMATPPPTPWSNEVRVDQGSYRHVVQDTAAFTEKRPPLPVLRMTWSDVVDALSKEIEGTMKFKLTWDPFRQPTSDEVKRYIPTPNNWQIQREARHESFRDMAVLKREAGELEEIFTCENLSMLNITFRHDEEKIKNGTSKWTITLHDAARRGLLGTLRILLDASAEVDKVDSDGLTALHLAARNGHTRIVEALLKAKATPNASHNVVWTPLHLAVRNNHNNICQLLLDYGASPNAGDDMTPPLFDAVLFRQSSIVSTLLNAGANPNTVQQVADDLRDVTALHLAAELGLTDIVKLLLAAGARTDAVTSSGMLPLHQATMDGHTDTVLLLLDAGSDINAMDGQGVTPLDFAIHGGHERTAEEIRLRGGVHKILEAMPWD